MAAALSLSISASDMVTPLLCSCDKFSSKEGWSQEWCHHQQQPGLAWNDMLAACNSLTIPTFSVVGITVCPGSSRSLKLSANAHLTVSLDPNKSSTECPLLSIC